MLREIRLHAGVLAIILGTTWLLVRFTRIPTGLLEAIPPVFFIYLGTFWIISRLRAARKGDDNEGDSP